jgi:hypothetical protein
MHGEILDSDVVNAMIRYGGSFVKRLGDAFLAADAVNFRKLRDTFPEYWEQYYEAAKLQDQQAHGGKS